MLNEEVAKYRELSGDTNPNVPISRIGGYLDGYEKALEQEPCEDAISRQAVLEVLKDKWNMFSDANDAMQESIDTIEALSNVTPQPKTGYISIDDVMSVFDDFMRGEADEDGTDTFLKMLKDRAECEG